ncbi:Alstrom syndrome protein 1 isoform X2 [Ornithorhynchus anatinus]|uniref:Alstrom syndrome protein 1 isoform X2 n=1 Tax=Ornithorhynchus anatinus TaxID=9258 RepID=UPI0010A86FE0|nr:Alstrom syndrome protein 1 isoform X2 [Ornithorhynchus anatinus]
MERPPGEAEGAGRGRPNWSQPKTDSWHQLSAEIDLTQGMDTTRTSSSPLRGEGHLSELPSLEEGPLVSPEDGGKEKATFSPSLAFGDSGISPHLPLAASSPPQEPKVWDDDTSFQRTDLDFAPLRATPDQSEMTEGHSRPSRPSEALLSAASGAAPDLANSRVSLSRHTLAATGYDASLSQHPFTLPGQEDDEGPASPEPDGGHPGPSGADGLRVLGSQTSREGQAQTAPASASPNPGAGAQAYFPEERPAPFLLGLLEKEVGLLTSLEAPSFSGRRPSCEPVSPGNPEESQVRPEASPSESAETPSVEFGEEPPPIFTEEEMAPEGASSGFLEGQPVKNPPRPSANCGKSPEAPPAAGADAADVRGRPSGRTTRSVGGPPGKSPVAKFPRQQQKEAPPSSPDQPGANEPAPLRAATVDFSGREIRPEGSGAKTSASSGDSSGGEKKERDSPLWSHPFLDEKSFFRRLTRPIHQSTPGLSAAKAVTREGGFRPLPVTPDPQASLSCRSDGTSESPGKPPVPNRAPPPSDGNTNRDNFPPGGMVPPLPTLSFLEKIGAWDTRPRDDRSPEVPAAPGPCGVSGRPRAREVIAGSSGRTLSPVGGSPVGGAESGMSPPAREGMPLDASRPRSGDGVGQERPRPEAADVPSRGDGRAGPLGLPDVTSDEAEGRRSGLGVPGSAPWADPGKTGGARASGRDAGPSEERGVEALGGDGREERSLRRNGSEPSRGPDVSAGLLPVNRFGAVFPEDGVNRPAPLPASAGAVEVAATSVPVAPEPSVDSLGAEEICSPSPPQTPTERELNIEDRIPVYLRNLGIDQSPSSILTPFVPRGPIREPEFSPSEFSASRLSSDALRKTVAASGGGSPQTAGMSQSSSVSGTSVLDASIPSDSDTGPDSPSPQLDGRSPSETPINQRSDFFRQAADRTSPAEDPGGRRWGALPPLEPPARGDATAPSAARRHGESPGPVAERVRALIDSLGLRDCDLNSKDAPSRLLFASLFATGAKDGSPSPDVKPPGGWEKRGVGNPPAVGSATLKEVRTLLAEAEDEVLKRFDPVPHLVPFRELGDFSTASLEDPVLPRDSSFAEETGGASPPAGSPPWNESLAADIAREEANPLKMPCSLRREGRREPLVGRTPIERTASREGFERKTRMASEETPGQYEATKSPRRCEPEGCSGATGAKTVPAVPVGGAEADSEADSEASGTRGPLRLVPRHPPPGPARVNVTGEPGAESDGGSGSSGDSLAARVRKLLRNETPGSRAPSLRPEDVKSPVGSLAWGKLHPSSLELTEEDRRRVEAIRSQLLLTERNSGFGESPRKGGFLTATAERPRVRSRTPTPPERGTGQAPGSRGAQPVSCGDRSGASDPEFRTWTSMPSPGHRPPQTPAADTVSPGTGLRTPFCEEDDGRLSRAAGERSTPPQVGALDPDGPFPGASKRITSITFASRRRSKSFSGSPPGKNPLAAESLGGFGSLPTEEERQGDEEEALYPASSRRLSRSLERGLNFSSESDKLSREVAWDVEDSRRKSHLSAAADLGAWEAGPGPGLGGGGYEGIQSPLRDVFWRTGGIYSVDSDTETSAGLGLPAESPRGSTEPRWGHGVPATDQKRESPSRFPQTFLTNHACVGGEDKPYFPPEVTQADSSSAVPPSSPAQGAGVTPASCPSPTRKALSCVRITLSPQSANSQTAAGASVQRAGASVAGARARPSDRFELSPEAGFSKAPSLASTSKLLTAHPPPHAQTTGGFPPPKSAGPSPLPDGLAATQELDRSYSGKSQAGPVSRRTQVDISDSIGHPARLSEDLGTAASPPTGRPSSSDAITQITTESPEKTTFSAEIFVNGEAGESALPEPPRRKVQGPPNPPPPWSPNQFAAPRGPDVQPLLLPYKPSRSAAMYYVPHPKEIPRYPRTTSESTSESTHSGSNDAVAPEFPAEALGRRDESLSGVGAGKHEEGIYSKRARPRVAWAEGKTTFQEATAESHERFGLADPPRPTLRPAQFSLHPSACGERDPDLGSPEPPGKGAGRPPGREDFFPFRPAGERDEPGLSPLYRGPREEDRFSPLRAEPDHGRTESPGFQVALGRGQSRQAAQKANGDPGAGLSVSRPPGDEETGRDATRHPDGEGDLWTRFPERQEAPRLPQSSRWSEPSLVERLERLARLLRIPNWNSLLLPEGEREDPKGWPGDGGRGQRRGPREKQRPRKEGEGLDVPPGPSGAYLTPGPWRDPRPEAQRACSPQSKQAPPQWPDSDVASGASPHPGSVASPSDQASRAGTEALTEASASVSSIDTARLVRAFGPERVCVSPRLSQLYRAISRQKTHPGRAGRRRGTAADAQHPKMASERGRGREGTEVGYATSSASVSTLSWGPSSALRKKRSVQMHHKSVQVGDLEIVNSATKKNTRDVGLTFPTPRSGPERPRVGWSLAGTAFPRSGPGGSPQPGDGRDAKRPADVGDRKSRKSRWHPPEGLSWFVPAESVKADARKENRAGPGPAWFEPLTGAKPWREPLREKNWQELAELSRAMAGVRPAAPWSGRDEGQEAPKPFVKASLQESLALHRPDFISRSRERVKQLKSVTAQRKLQRALLRERDEFFGSSDHWRGCRDASCPLSVRGFLMAQKRIIPKKEMLQRSKRIYEQLPEVRKKREDEKRRAEYSSYRLKAQLYKTKITNRVLGRKASWE